MRNNFKLIIGIIIGCIVTGTITYAATGLTTRNISYGNDTLKGALDDLYKKYDLNSVETKKVCQLESEEFGNKGEVGAKYKCQLGADDKDENGVIYRYFYILAVNNDNTVDLIMDRNITQGTSYKTLSWIDAMDFFDNNQVADGLGTSIKSKWINALKVGLPDVQAIANAVNNQSWKVATKNEDNLFCFGLKDQSSCAAGNWTYATDAGKTAVASYKWLFNYTYNCADFGCDDATSLGSDESRGYWTRDAVYIQSSSKNIAWNVSREGIMTNNSTSQICRGVRPVITLLKSNLYE